MSVIGNLPVTFCRNVTWLRRRYYLSRRALAALSGLSEATLLHMEGCERSPDISSAALERLGEIFHVGVDRLVHTDLRK